MQCGAITKGPQSRVEESSFLSICPPSGLTSIPGKPLFQPYNAEEDVMGYAIRVDGLLQICRARVIQV